MEKYIFEEKYIVYENEGIVSVFSTIRQRYLKPYDSGGYIVFRINNRAKFAHHLVTEFYLGKRDSNLCVNHKDGNKLNNKIENLEYVTWSENIKHSYRTGLHALSKDTTRSPKYIDGRCKDIKKYKDNWYLQNRERILKMRKDNYKKKS